MADHRRSCGGKSKKRKLLVYDDDIEVVSARTNKTIVKFSPRDGIDISRRTAFNERQIQNAIGLNSNLVTEGDEGVVEIQDICEFRKSGQNSQYRIQQEKLNGQWTRLREGLIKSYIENEGMPQGQCCTVCELEIACLRCQDCGPNVYFCKPCGISIHQDRCQFHFVEEWFNQQEFCPFLEQPIPLLKLPATVFHKKTCAKFTRLIHVVDHHGRQHLGNMELCSCQEDAAIFVLHRLWPASPYRPQLCFEFAILDMLESLVLENQTSLKGFCDGIKEKLPKLIRNNGKNIYKALKGQTFTEYRYFKHELCHLQSVCPEFSQGNVCPACPKDHGNIYMTMDACFGLVRKKSASKYNLPSRHADLFFLDQDNVDSFVASYNATKTVKKDCHNFNAGSVISENLSRNKLFDIKAVFGSVCRHEFPLKFLDLKHGERIAYPVLLINEQLEALSLTPDLNLHVSYDIACILKKHLKSSGQNSILERISLSLPAFHTYAHRPLCQVNLGPKYCKNIGLTDGEQCERLWSYLRCFSAITKEMTVSNRKDLLTDALLYYSQKKIEKLPALLCKRLVKAKKLANESEEGLKELLQTLPVSLPPETIACWVDEQVKETASLNAPVKENAVSWQKHYVKKLLHNRHLRQSLMGDNMTEDLASQSVAFLRSSEKELKDFEKKHNVKKRWDLSSPGVKDIVIDVLKEERAGILKNLRILAFERTFLIGIKRKYADGQKLAKSLSKTINQKVNAMEKLFSPFNRKVKYLKKVTPEMDVETIDKSSVFCVDNEIYNELDSVHTDARIPSCLKLKAVNLFLTWKRSLEEIDLLHKDAQNTTNFLFTEWQKIRNAIERFDNRTMFDVGARALLYQELSSLTLFATSTLSLFEQQQYFPDCLTLDFQAIKESLKEKNTALKSRNHHLIVETDEDQGVTPDVGEEDQSISDEDDTEELFEY